MEKEIILPMANYSATDLRDSFNIHVYSDLRETTDEIYYHGRNMKYDLVNRMVNIERRLRGLKAPRKVEIGQLPLFEQDFSFSLTLEKFAGPTYDQYAEYQATVVCAGSPVVDLACDGFTYGAVLGIYLTGISWSITGNVAVAAFTFLNNGAGTLNIPLVVKVFALNGLSATCVRTH